MTETASPGFADDPSAAWVSDVQVPDCPESQAPSEEEGTYAEIMAAVATKLLALESFRYRALYAYATEDGHPADELALAIVGEHSGNRGVGEDTAPRLDWPVRSTSQAYRRSHTLVTDLRTQSWTETILADDAAWLRSSDRPEWLSLSHATPEVVVNLPEFLGPYGAAFMTAGGLGLMPGVRTYGPNLVEQQTVGGIQVTHRCWIPPTYEDLPINAYLVHWESLYTFLHEAQVHLWTSDSDTGLIRFAITGKHSTERYFEEGQRDHSTPYSFTYWIELSDANRLVAIASPTTIAQELDVSITGDPASLQGAWRHTDLPLPPDAIPASPEPEPDSAADLGAYVRREFLVPGSSLHEGNLDWNLGMSWNTASADRRASYETALGVREGMDFYLREMRGRGWGLSGFQLELQPGQPHAYLFFMADGIPTAVILQATDSGGSRIDAFLPPQEDRALAIAHGWRAIGGALVEDGSVSPLGAIALDSDGRAWIGTAQGLASFDGRDWDALAPGSSDPSLRVVNDIEIDRERTIWIASGPNLVRYDGQTWRSFTLDDMGLGEGINDQYDPVEQAIVDSAGIVWVRTPGGVSAYSNGRWTSYPFGSLRQNPEAWTNDEAIAVDHQGRLWAAMEDRLLRLDSGVWVDAGNDAPEAANCNPHYLAVDTHDGIWTLSTEGALCALEKGQWARHVPGEGEPSLGGPVALAIDGLDRIWIATFPGSVVMLGTDGKFLDFTPLDPAISNYWANSIAVDNLGRVWVVSNYGVNTFTPPEG